MLKINSMFLSPFVLHFLILLIPLKNSNATDFSERIDLGTIELDEINEASGIAASKTNPGILYLHNDSGGENVIYAVNENGAHIGKYILEGSMERDWEDIAVGPGPDETKSYIYVGNIGDNDAKYDLKFIYRLHEPVIDSNQKPVTDTLKNVETITFRLPEKNRDTETVMIDPWTRDIVIISKREIDVIVYLLPFPQSTTETMVAEKISTLRLTWIVGGDIAPGGNEILIKSTDAIYYYNRFSGQTIAEVFNNPPRAVSTYVPEPQGEAICWKPDASGFYTVSEERNKIPAHLYFYHRQK